MELILIKLKPCSLSRGIAFRIMQELSNLALREARQVYNILWSLSETPNCMFLAIIDGRVKFNNTSGSQKLYGRGNLAERLQ